MWSDLRTATMLLTRLPVRVAAPDLSRSVWAFPLVGAAVGAGGALVLAAGRTAGLPQPVAAVWAVAAMALMTGALHEDGLADVADGFGGGRGAARKLEIMRDSRIGSYGALALALAVAARVAALSAAPRPEYALVVTGALSRASLGLPLLLLRPARGDGLGATVAGCRWAAWVGFAIAVLVGALSWPALVAAAIAALAVTGLARAQIGGFTGDVLGACAVVSECAALSALAR